MFRVNSVTIQSYATSHGCMSRTLPSARLVRRSMSTFTPSAAPALRSHDAKPKHLLSA